MPRSARAAAVALALGAALGLVAACGRPAPPAPATAEGLAAYVAGLAAGDPAAVARELAAWPLDRALWERTLVEPYRGLWDQVDPRGHLAALGAALAANARGATGAAGAAGATLRPGAGLVNARRHYAGDPRLTPGQLWLRWALPPLYPSFVVELGGRPLDTVFLHDGVRWRALAGLDELIRARVRALDAACAALLDEVVASADCATAAWEVAEAALRIQPDRFARACRLAATRCGKRSP